MTFELSNGDWRSDHFPIGNDDDEPEKIACLQCGKEFKNNKYDRNHSGYIEIDGKKYEGSICLDCWNKS